MGISVYITSTVKCVLSGGCVCVGGSKVAVWSAIHSSSHGFEPEPADSSALRFPAADEVMLRLPFWYSDNESGDV